MQLSTRLALAASVVSARGTDLDHLTRRYMGIQVHPGCVNRQESGAEKISLRKLTLSVSLLTASLMLAAPAQAETWSC